MTLDYTVRPLSDRTWLRRTGSRQYSDFTSTWSDTLELLAREIRAINGKQVVIGIDIREQDLRIDGRLRANARPVATHGVEVAFDSKHGPLIYRSDKYLARSYQNRMEPWQHNVRAVALTLQALRAVDRYGAAESGEQYRGYKALPAGTGAVASGMTVTAAAEVLLRAAGTAPHGLRIDKAAFSPETWQRMIRTAKAEVHPDRNGGERAQWNLLENALDVLRRSGWVE